MDNILDTIMGAKTHSDLAGFEPAHLVSEILSDFRDRDREILTRRFGLDGAGLETLETIGKKFTLTRERVRQIEKDCLHKLKQKSHARLDSALQLIFDTIAEHGNVISEEFLIENLVINKSNLAIRRAIKLLLALGDQFHEIKETDKFYPSWSVVGFHFSELEEAVKQFTDVLAAEGKVMPLSDLIARFANFNDKVIRSYLNIAKTIQINPFGEIGLKDWIEIKPRDVGDKAYLVLKHNGKPQHYSTITDLINQSKFDNRVAYKETVHNELIKDTRFVLVGRGIYALSEWGYKSGVVADVIKEILRNAAGPLSREEIISEVLRRRMVKRNTILVGLSNKKHFQKVGKDKYSLAA